MKIKFQKGKQRQFIDNVLKILNCPSLKELINRGIEINYSSLKNYYCERRLLPKELFNTLCEISKINKNTFIFNEISDNWGQIKGGKISKRI
jgi:hypothetical protein